MFNPFRTAYRYAYTLYHTLGDKLGIADCLNATGMVSREQKTYDEAMKLHKQSLTLYEEVKDEWGQAHALNNIGVVWYRSDTNVEEVVKIHEKSLEIRKKIQDTLGISSSLGADIVWSVLTVTGNIAVVKLKQKQYAEAFALYQESLKYREELGDRWGCAGSHLMLGTICVKTGKRSNGP